MTELQQAQTDVQGTLWPRALLTVHYLRAQLLVNRPAITAVLRSWVSASSKISQAIDDVAFTVLKSDLVTARQLVSLVLKLTRDGNELLLRHAIWFTANYSGKSSMPNIVSDANMLM